MEKLVLIDGNSIMNRAFYGIMGSKMLTTKDGKYTNAVYGFLAILFNIIDDIKPEYIAVAFDLKGKLKRKELFEGYKANRHGMPDELAEQMPVIKDVLRAMNIDIIEKEGYEGDDILGTLAKYGEKQGLEVTILSGDRDTFQLASDNITIRIPRTKAGKTETENYNREKVLEEYELEPVQLIEVKALQGDTSDNIPGVPGIGPKTAVSLIQKYHSVKELYEKIEKGEDDLKGKQKENIVANKDMAELSRTLGEIDTNVPLEDTLENLKVEEWDKAKVLEIFEELRFQRYIDRFGLRTAGIVEQPEKENVKIEVKDITEIPNLDGKLYYYLDLQDNSNEEDIIKKDFKIQAITDGPGVFVIHNNIMDKLVKTNTRHSIGLTIEKNAYNEVKAYVESLVKANENLNGSYIDVEIASSELAIKITKIMGYSLVVLIGVIGFINLINSMITSIITRKKELGMLQAIGLTNKQLVQMLNKEAMFYTSFMLIGSLTIGNIIGYSAVQAMRKSGMSYAVYVLPINQMIIMIVCIVLAQFILTYLISKNFNKESLIDRVRYSE